MHSCQKATELISKPKHRRKTPGSGSYCLNTDHCLNFCSHSTDVGYTPNSKFCLVVKTDVATHAPTEYGKVYYSYNDIFWGEQSRIPSRSQNGLRDQGGESDLGFYCA